MVDKTFFQKHISFNIFYFVIIISNLLFLRVFEEYRMVSKPFIIASLLGFYISIVRKQSPVFILALIFALIGDILLMFKGETFFLMGLGSFLIMQILYTFLFLKDKSWAKNSWIIVLSIILLGSIFFFTLSPKLGEMKIPVAFYTAAITCMTIAAGLRKITLQGYLLVFLGAIFFMISDSAIAFDRFYSTFQGADFVIILTYMIAQYLIVRGVIEDNNMQ